jgi:hypothetical protein
MECGLHALPKGLDLPERNGEGRHRGIKLPGLIINPNVRRPFLFKMHICSKEVV